MQSPAGNITQDYSWCLSHWLLGALLSNPIIRIFFANIFGPFRLLLSELLHFQANSFGDMSLTDSPSNTRKDQLLHPQ